MPLPSLLTLIDDVAGILDDVSVLTKVAAKKTAGVLGDDLALNAQQVSGVDPTRELPVVWAVAKGSAVNKLILVPSALGISAVLPAAITPLLMLGGAFLCFEGFEKVAEKVWPRGPVPGPTPQMQMAVDPPAPLPTAGVTAESGVPASSPLEEKDKVKGAIRTDFVLSAEIIVITLGTVALQPLALQIATLSTVAVLMTVGVYGLVAGIVKLDDWGLALCQSRARATQLVGRLILQAAPRFMKFLGVAGTIAMFLVGGDILAHGIPGLSATVEQWRLGPLSFILPSVVGGFIGVFAGAVLVGIYHLLGRAVPRLRRHA